MLLFFKRKRRKNKSKKLNAYKNKYKFGLTIHEYGRFINKFIKNTNRIKISY